MIDRMTNESRRELLARAMREAGRAASPFVERRIERAQQALDAEPAKSSVRAAEVAGTASPEQALQLARELGIAVEEVAMRERARVSLALTIASGRHDQPAATHREGGAVLTLSLEEPLLSGSELAPRRGALRLSLADDGDWRVSHGDGDGVAGQHVAHSLSGGGVLLRATRELVLAREWSEEVQELGLDEDARAAWGRLRARLAALQGRELYGESDGAISHRWLGLPDDRSGSMPLECELRASGVFQRGLPALAHPEASALSSRSSRWRLLLQLSDDERLGWRWGERGERLHVWMTERDLREGRFDRTQAVLR